MSRTGRITNENRWIAVASLNGDPAYQRPLRERWAKFIADNLDDRAVGVIEVSERADGTFWIIDGQHRVAALRLLGWDKAGQKIECKVWKGLTLQQEAKLYNDLNNFKNLRFIDRFRARVRAGDDVAVAIAHIVTGAGFTIADNQSARNICALQACERVYLGKGFHVGGIHPKELKTALETIRQAWGANEDGVRGEMVQGIGWLMLRDVARIEIPVLASKLSTYSGGPSALLGNARGLRGLRGGHLVDAVAEIIVELYNKGRRMNKLEPWR